MIRLSNWENDELYINESNITIIEQKKKWHTKILTNDGRHREVKETPEEILQLIREEQSSSKDKEIDSFINRERHLK